MAKTSCFDGMRDASFGCLWQKIVVDVIPKEVCSWVRLPDPNAVGQVMQATPKVSSSRLTLDGCAA